MSYITAHPTTFTWGTTSFQIVSVQVSASAGGEIDITSMSSEVIADPNDPNRKLIVPDYEVARSARYGGEIAIDFYADPQITAANYFDVVGSKRQFTLTIPGGEAGTTSGSFTIQKTATLIDMQLSVGVGEYVRGSASFKISGR